MNLILSTNAVTTEGILYWSYGISNRSCVKSLSLSEDGRENVKLRMMDLKVEAAFIQSAVNKELKLPHLRAIIEAKYGERQEAVFVCAEKLYEHARSLSLMSLIRLVEHFCQFRACKVREVMELMKFGRGKARESRSRIEGILEGWNWLALEAVEAVFREEGWVE